MERPVSRGGPCAEGRVEPAGSRRADLRRGLASPTPTVAPPLAGLRLTHNPSRSTVEPEIGGYLGDVGLVTCIAMTCRAAAAATAANRKGVSVMTEDELAEALLAAWKAGTLRRVFQEQFPQLGPAERTAWINTLTAKLDVPDEVAAEEYRRQQLQQLTHHYAAGTLRDHMHEQHPEWSEDQIEFEVAKLAVYFDNLKGGL